MNDIEIMEATAQAVLPPQMPAHLVAALKVDEVIPKGTRKAMFPLDEGDVTLLFPEGISSESLKDLDAYLTIFLKKEIKKSEAQPTPTVDEMLR